MDGYGGETYGDEQAAGFSPPAAGGGGADRGAGGMGSGETTHCDVNELCSGHASKCMQRGSKHKCRCLPAWSGNDCSAPLGANESSDARSDSVRDSEYDNPAAGDYKNEYTAPWGDGGSNHISAGDDYGDGSSDGPLAGLGLPVSLDAAAQQKVILVGAGLGLIMMTVVVVLCRRLARRCSDMCRQVGCSAWSKCPIHRVVSCYINDERPNCFAVTCWVGASCERASEHTWCRKHGSGSGRGGSMGGRLVRGAGGRLCFFYCSFTPFFPPSDEERQK